MLSFEEGQKQGYRIHQIFSTSSWIRKQNISIYTRLSLKKWRNVVLSQKICNVLKPVQKKIQFFYTRENFHYKFLWLMRFFRNANQSYRTTSWFGDCRQICLKSRRSQSMDKPRRRSRSVEKHEVQGRRV